ncbi:tRNA (adenosine(37)-N6)-threonylcarbamoyltransferase complex transferase subunit TsaD, partial [archaeon]|nr:tRNA (adenosine(37)-N6)-threonylcarbamoyltransferase complex transferase subunit TsaD [archaeon]
STAHTFGAGIVDDKCRVLANEKSMYANPEGGIHTTEAAGHHRQAAGKVIEQALLKAGKGIEGIDLIAFSQGPGLPPCLLVGLNEAKRIAVENSLPLVGVNHCIAHIEIGRKLAKAVNPLTCYASGANTQIIGFENGKYRVYGETLDIGIGNALDMFARGLGIGFPGGPVLDEMYFKSSKLIELPYTVKGMDLAFSGLLTAAKQLIGKEKKEDLAYSFMHHAFAMLTEATERALAHTEKKELILTGGVAASKALNEMMEKMCLQRHAGKFAVEKPLAADNGAMIAWLGLVQQKAGYNVQFKEIDIKPLERTDQVEASWI